MAQPFMPFETTTSLGVPFDTFGLVAINAANYSDAHNGQDEEALIELAGEIEQTRYSLAALTKEQKALFGPYIASVIGDCLEGAPAEDERLVDYLTENGRERLLMNLVRRNYWNVREQQPVALPMFRAAKERFITQTLEGIDGGLISEDARELVPGVRRLRTKVGDPWLTHLQQRQGLSYINRDPEGNGSRGDLIVIGQGMGFSPEEWVPDLQYRIDLYFPHEGRHGVFDRKFPMSVATMLAWFVEGTNAHIDVVEKYGQPEILAPELRAQDDGIYPAFRNFLHFLATAGTGEPVDPRYFTRAYSSSGFDRPDWVACEEKLDQRWGVIGSMFRISRAFARHNTDVMADHPDWDWLRVWDEATSRTQADMERDPSLVLGENARALHRKETPRAIGKASVTA